MVLFHNNSGVPRPGKLGKAQVAYVDAAGLFCCDKSDTVFKQAVHILILAYNNRAWQISVELNLRLR